MRERNPALPLSFVAIAIESYAGVDEGLKTACKERKTEVHGTRDVPSSCSSVEI
jgi:hypothetical protein